MFVFITALATPTVIFAAEKNRPAPLHIKMTAAQKTTAPGIRIHHGKIPKPNRASPKITNAALKSAAPPRIGAPLTALPANLLCAMTRTNPLPENRLKNMADSLSAYMIAQKRDPKLITILREAAQKTGTDFEVLVLKAMLESDLGRTQTAASSTARGVFQYIETTWLTLLHRYGARIGMPHYAAAITLDAQNGQPVVRSSASFSRADLLKLRFDPRISALIKGYQMREESVTLSALKTSGPLSATDHYIAHMLGLSLAQEFYTLHAQGSPQILAQSGNPLFREAVSLNPAFFYDEKGAGLTATQAYQQFTTRIGKAITTLRDIETRYGKITPLPADCTAPAQEAVEIRAAMAAPPPSIPARDVLPPLGLNLPQSRPTL